MVDPHRERKLILIILTLSSSSLPNLHNPHHRILLSQAECVNKENLLGEHLADGAAFTLIDGDEYRDIFPVWDVSHLFHKKTHSTLLHLFG